MNIRPIRPFEVVVKISAQASYIIDARSPEEAEAIAEDSANEGDFGMGLVDLEVQAIDAYPADSITSDELIRERD